MTGPLNVEEGNMNSTGNDDQRFEAIKAVIALANQLSDALAEADRLGADMVISYGELNIDKKRLKQVIARTR
jgi:hypothetical protein